MSSVIRALPTFVLVVLSVAPSTRHLAFSAGAASCSDRSSSATGPAVSVMSFGARADGQTPDTAAIQSAVDATPAGGTLRFPSGTYLIETNRGIQLKDDIRVELGDAVLKGPNVAGARCKIFEIQGRRNVMISGGTLIGSRDKTPQWGVGILASDAEDLTLENVTLRDFNLDGILVTGNQGCRRVVVRGCVTDTNRRTGLAIVHATDVTVENSTFSNTRGSSPESGVNCEPNKGEEVRNVTFNHCTFRNNANGGLYAHKALGVATGGITLKDSVLEDNKYGVIANAVEGLTITGNRLAHHKVKATSAIIVVDSSGVVVASNSLEDNYRGIHGAASAGIEIRGNTIVGTGPAGTPGGGNGQIGVLCQSLHGLLENACTVADNTIRRSGGAGIMAQTVLTVKITGNTVSDSGQRGIYLDSTSRSEIRGNVISGAGQETPGRYDGIELVRSSHSNLVSGNRIHLSPGMRNPIGVGPGCTGNRVLDNTVLP